LIFFLPADPAMMVQECSISFEGFGKLLGSKYISIGTFPPLLNYKRN